MARATRKLALLTGWVVLSGCTPDKTDGSEPSGGEESSETGAPSGDDGGGGTGDGDDTGGTDGGEDSGSGDGGADSGDAGTDDTGDETAKSCETDEDATRQAVWLCIDGMN